METVSVLLVIVVPATVGWVKRSADPTRLAISAGVGSSLSLDPTYGIRLKAIPDPRHLDQTRPHSVAPPRAVGGSRRPACARAQAADQPNRTAYALRYSRSGPFGEQSCRESRIVHQREGVTVEVLLMLSLALVGIEAGIYVSGLIHDRQNSRPLRDPVHRDASDAGQDLPQGHAGAGAGHLRPSAVQHRCRSGSRCASLLGAAAVLLLLIDIAAHSGTPAAAQSQHSNLDRGHHPR